MAEKMILMDAESDSLDVTIRRGLPAELLNELFVALPLEKAFDLLAKMANGFLARKVRKMLKSVKMAMKGNKWNAADCGQKLSISKEGLVVNVKQIGRFYEKKFVRASLPILKFNSNISSIAYFDVEILKKKPIWLLHIGFCTRRSPFENNIWLVFKNNLLQICYKEGMSVKNFHITSGNANKFQIDIGDMLGIGLIHSPANSSMKWFATRNGEFLGMGELPAKFAMLQFFPAVTLFGNGNSIRANFGKNE